MSRCDLFGDVPGVPGATKQGKNEEPIKAHEVGKNAPKTVLEVVNMWRRLSVDAEDFERALLRLANKEVLIQENVEKDSRESVKMLYNAWQSKKKELEEFEKTQIAFFGR